MLEAWGWVQAGIFPNFQDCKDIKNSKIWRVVDWGEGHGGTSSEYFPNFHPIPGSTKHLLNHFQEGGGWIGVACLLKKVKRCFVAKPVMNC